VRLVITSVFSLGSLGRIATLWLSF
jgi:hypothetical protein